MRVEERLHLIVVGPVALQSADVAVRERCIEHVLREPVRSPSDEAEIGALDAAAEVAGLRPADIPEHAVAHPGAVLPVDRLLDMLEALRELLFARDEGVTETEQGFHAGERCSVARVQIDAGKPNGKDLRRGVPRSGRSTRWAGPFGREACGDGSVPP